MVIIKALLLFLLYDGTFGQGESSQACQNITEALYANQDCQQTFTAITSSNATNVTLSELQGFCAQDCRNIIVQHAMECVSYTVIKLYKLRSVSLNCLYGHVNH